MVWVLSVLNSKTDVEKIKNMNKSLKIYRKNLEKEAWLNDCDGVFQNKGEEMPKDISWNFIATVLLAGSYYK
ncbi:hypothetical protein CN984_03195 [Bacillus cereus]|uniref:DUF7660 domain-containing protein n=1 Tax=Bacillus cereus TaxID=1396 RepID=A0A2B9QH78_BACCE|nr:hypothetical protein CN984_03195 [Bacillus cereus]